MSREWSTASGKRLMVPRTKIDEPMAEPSAKKPRVSDNALVSPHTVPVSRKPSSGKQQNLAAFRCVDCEGTHFWGHG